MVSKVVLFFCLSSFVPAELLASQALVRSYGNPALEIGQAYLVQHGKHCLAILPTHVVVEAGRTPGLLREGNPQLLGEARTIYDLGDDLSILVVAGNITSKCGTSISSVSRATEDRIRDAGGFLTLRLVNADSTTAQLPVAIVDNDTNRYLHVKPIGERSKLSKGQSGGVLFAGASPVGMLLSVDGRLGAGRILRLDAMLGKIEQFLRTQQFAESQQSADDNTGGLTVVGWSSLPKDAAHRAENLTSVTAGAPPWIAVVDSWPVEIELAVSGDKIAVSGIELDALNVRDSGHLPCRFEIFVNSITDRSRWSYVTETQIAFENGLAQFAFAPLWARQLKLVFHEACDGGDTLALNRIRVTTDASR